MRHISLLKLSATVVVVVAAVVELSPVTMIPRQEGETVIGSLMEFVRFRTLLHTRTAAEIIRDDCVM
jgi:hypothetical protein